MTRTIPSSAREVIYRVFIRCLSEYETKTTIGSDLYKASKRTAELTGKSETTVRRVFLEGQRNNGKFSKPKKHKTGRPKKEISHFNLCAIRQKVQFLIAVKKEVPTLRNLLPILREDLGFDGSHEHLRQMLKVLGFKYAKCQSKRSIWIEKLHLAAKRADYLKIILSNRNLPEEQRKVIVYLDEAYVHQSYKLEKCWQSINLPGAIQSITKEKRYIIIYAGNENGFIPNASLTFPSSEMNRTNFKKYVIKKLIPNLPPTSIVVMENAPYHSVVINKAPTSDSSIAEIKKWLSHNQIHFDDTLLKPQLLMLVKRHKPAPKYEIDEILGEHGHTVVRLPPCHCDLNPIELMWDIAKQKVAAQNVASINIKEAAQRVIDVITQGDWKKSCERIIEIEKAYHELELILYEDIDLPIGLDDGSSSTSDSEIEEDSILVTQGNLGYESMKEEYLDEDEEDEESFQF